MLIDSTKLRHFIYEKIKDTPEFKKKMFNTSCPVQSADLYDEIDRLGDINEYDRSFTPEETQAKIDTLMDFLRDQWKRHNEDRYHQSAGYFYDALNQFEQIIVALTNNQKPT